MSNSKSKFKKIICSAILCLGLLISGVAGTHYNVGAINVNANASSSGYITRNVTSTVFGSGSDFGGTSVSTKPNTTVTGWTTSDNIGDKENVIHGVVSLKDETTFDAEKWGLDTKPKMGDADKDDDAYHKNLMINAQSLPGNNFGYTSNKTLSLEANSYYQISVYLNTYKTEESDPRASIYLDGLLEESDENYNKTKFESISTLGSWETYSFYIDTKEAKSVKLELWLGSKTDIVQGAVFFNEITITRYSEESYNDATSHLIDNDNDSFNIISFSTEFDSPFESDNASNSNDIRSFENSAAQAWTRTFQSTSSATDQIFRIVDVKSNINVADNKTISAPLSNGSIDNNNALFLYNKEDGYQAIESPEIVIKEKTYYHLSFWAKSDCNIGDGAKVLLVDQSENPITSASLTLSTTYEQESNIYRNNWTQYNFYIYGPALSDGSATIQIWLGQKDDTTSGYVFVDDFRMEVINSTTYSDNSSASNSTTFNLNNASDKFTIANGDFNITQNTEVGTIYPLAPSKWTHSKTRNGIKYQGTDSVYSGVINTDPDIFDNNKSQFGAGSIIPTCPPALEGSSTNNVLMIGSTNDAISQSFESESFTLSANSYYTLSFYVMTDYTNRSSAGNYGARVSVASSTKTIFDLYNIKFEDDNWHKISVKIKTGTVNESSKITLAFNEWHGHIFFDKIELRSITANIFTDKTYESANTYRVDLAFENFDNKTFGKKGTQSTIETPNNWNFSLTNSETGVNSGIINENNSLLSEVPPALTGEANYLYISSSHDGYYYYTSKESYTFDSETFYKISINVLTRGGSADGDIYREDVNINDEDGEIVYGASISLSDSSEIILKGIKTNGNWKTYTIYASFTETVTSPIRLSLGYTDEECKGEVLFDSLKITKFSSAEDYNSEIDSAQEGSFAEFTNYTPPETEEDEEVTPWTSSFNWVIVPSLITGLAIIIAVIGYYVRKLTINRKPKIKTNYDRRKTLDKDIDKREKIALRKQIIEELRAELQSIDQEIADFNIVADEKLNQIKEQIQAEQEELKKEKLEIEIRKKEATANREKQLKEDPDFVSNTKAEKEYNNFISKLDRQEMAIQKKLSDQEFKLATAKEINNEKLNKYTARQEYIRLQIAKIEAEIEEIARQEEEMWAEYKAAKADAKRRKAEYKAQVKAEKEKNALAKKRKANEKTKSSQKSSTKKSSSAKTSEDNK